MRVDSGMRLEVLSFLAPGGLSPPMNKDPELAAWRVGPVQARRCNSNRHAAKRTTRAQKKEKN